MGKSASWDNFHKWAIEKHRARNTGPYAVRLHPKLVEARRKIEDLKMAKELGLEDDSTKK